MNINILNTRQDPQGRGIVVDVRIIVPPETPILNVAYALRDINRIVSPQESIPKETQS